MTEFVETCLILRPALASPCAPVWDDAVWVGEIWLDAVESAAHEAQSTGERVRCRLEAAQGYRKAQLLVRTTGRVLGFVEVDVVDGELNFAELNRRVADRLAASPPSTVVPLPVDPRHQPSVTVVVCTRDRQELLQTALESILAVDYPHFDVIIADNAPTTTATRDYVLGLGDPRVRLIEEPVPGASRARNAGLLAATGDIVAFADDDVVVDRYWLQALVAGFARGESVSCVSGIVPAAELRTPAQAYFDRRVGWASSMVPRVFELAKPPDDVPLFPFAPRCYGTGANFAVDRKTVGRMGFDEVLGAGVPTGGGEDLDLFVRILLSGRQLVHEPAAIVWHRHRADNDALLAQTLTYGLGLGAWLAKVMSNPKTARLAVSTSVRRVPALVRHVRAASKEVVPSDGLAGHLPSNIGDSMWKQVVHGALIYRRSRHDARATAPLLAVGQPESNVA